MSAKEWVTLHQSTDLSWISILTFHEAGLNVNDGWRSATGNKQNNSTDNGEGWGQRPATSQGQGDSANSGWESITRRKYVYF